MRTDRPTMTHCPLCGEEAHLGEGRVRSAFTWHTVGSVVVVVDLDLRMSVTNDAENVVAAIAERISLAGKRVLYRDTMGRLDELRVEGGRFAGIVPRGLAGKCPEVAHDLLEAT